MMTVTNGAAGRTIKATREVVDGEWVSFPGGELEGKRPKALCPACRAAVNRAAAGDTLPFRPRALCFECYRADIDRDRALRAAGALDTASVERFQSILPLEALNRPRLDMLKAEHAAARTASSVSPIATFVDRRRQAQIAARHALQQIAAGLSLRRATPVECEREHAAALHAAELQLPESWLPFVVSR
jgi:hypothetical protein